MVAKKPKVVLSRAMLAPGATRTAWVVGVTMAVLLACGACWFVARRARGADASYPVDGEGGCSSASGCGGGSCEGNPALDPVMEVGYNAQQMVKQSILLEDHLNQPAKACRDCQLKHMMTLSGLAEEAVSLAKTDSDKKAMQDASAFYNSIYAKWKEGAKPTDLASELRVVRKEMMSRYL